MPNNIQNEGYADTPLDGTMRQSNESNDVALQRELLNNVPSRRGTVKCEESKPYIVMVPKVTSWKQFKTEWDRAIVQGVSLRGGE